MDKFGDSLCQVVEHSPASLSQETVACLGVELVSAMETLHDLGFVYNDLKPDNILIGDDSIKQYISQKAKGFEESDMANHKLRLIDFGLASRYLDNEGNHIAEGG